MVANTTTSVPSHHHLPRTREKANLPFSGLAGLTGCWGNDGGAGTGEDESLGWLMSIETVGQAETFKVWVRRVDNPVHRQPSMRTSVPALPRPARQLPRRQAGRRLRRARWKPVTF